MSDDRGLEEARSQFEKIAGLVLALQSADVFAHRLNTAFCSARPAPPFELSAI
jgi:hypothetical protein